MTNQVIGIQKYISIKCNCENKYVYVEAEKYCLGKEDGIMMSGSPYVLCDRNGNKIKMRVTENDYIVYVQDGKTIIRKDIFNKIFKIV